MEVVEYRSKLVPTWIKVIGWIFVALGFVSFLAIFPLIFGVDVDVSLNLFGLVYDGANFNTDFVLVSGLYLYFAVSAFGLLKGKDWGLSACIANGYIGIAVCIYVMISGLSNGYINIRLEPIIQLFYLWRLYKIRPQWNQLPET